MSTEVWSAKIDTELKEKLQNIIKNEFDSSKDFIEQLVSTYELNKIKQGENVLSAEIDELESLTRRINNLFVNANEKINSLLADKDVKLAEQVEIKQKLIETLQVNIDQLKAENESINKSNVDLVNINNDLSEQVNQYTKSNSALEQLVTEYAKKNGTLTSLLDDYKSDHEANKTLQAELIKIKDDKRQIEDKIEKQEKEIAELNKKLLDQGRTHENEIQAIKSQHSIELSNITKQAEIETNMRILELQAEQQKKLNELQEKHNVEIEQYQYKYKELLEQIENSRNKTTNKENEIDK